jgi:ribosomal protein S18 acetylase RimI-like enzyme
MVILSEGAKPRSRRTRFLAANPITQLEILDLRHFSAAKLRPLLQDEALRWQRRLHWDYTRASNTLLEYLDGRILPGYVALRSGSIIGYAFCVFEAAKAVIGDVYALHETESLTNPVCDTLLHHLIELLQATPGVDRIESQLLMFPVGALAAPFRAAGFQSSPRLFMMAGLSSAPADSHPPAAPRPLFEPWHPAFYEPAAELILRCYTGHMDAGLNDQYRSLAGAQRFLHNIIRFPGCGVFDPANSWVLRNPSTHALDAVILCSRIRGDVGHITQLCVRPSLRGRGLGRLLLQHCAARLTQQGVRHLSLTVTEANTPALRLYHNNGFRTLHRFEAMIWEKSAKPQTLYSL